MTIAPVLTRAVGQAERALRALLDRHLDAAGLSFPAWTILVFLDTAGPLRGGELVARQLDGQVATEAAAQAAVDDLRSSGLLAPVASASASATTDTNIRNTDIRGVGGVGAPRFATATDPRDTDPRDTDPRDTDPRLTLTPAGEAVYRPIRQAVSRITAGLFADLPPADLDATARTLAQVATRANAQLAAAR